MNDESIVPGLAVSACENAVVNDNNSVNRFQLGRTYLSAGRDREAVEQFENAIDAGHPVAAGYAGDAYLFGRGVEKDSEKARKYYEKAVAGGFERAQAMLNAITFEGTIYMLPLATDLYQGIERLSDKLDLRKAADTNAYIFNFVTSFNEACNGVIKPSDLFRLMELRYKGSIMPDFEASGDYQLSRSAGDYDAQTFVRRHTCDGPVAERMISNFSAYIGLHKN